MIKKFENKNDTYMNLHCTPGQEDESISAYIKEISIIKKFPFSKVYISVPNVFFQKFIKKINDSGLKISDSRIKKNTIQIEF